MFYSLMSLFYSLILVSNMRLMLSELINVIKIKILPKTTFHRNSPGWEKPLTSTRKSQVIDSPHLLYLHLRFSSLLFCQRAPVFWTQLLKMYDLISNFLNVLQDLVMSEVLFIWLCLCSKDKFWAPFP